MRPFTRAVFASAVAMVLLTTAVDAKKKKDPELTRIIEKCDGCESLSFSHYLSSTVRLAELKIRSDMLSGLLSERVTITVVYLFV